MSDMCVTCRNDLALPGKDECKWCALERYEQMAETHRRFAELTAEHEAGVLSQDEAAA